MANIHELKEAYDDLQARYANTLSMLLDALDRLDEKPTEVEVEKIAAHAEGTFWYVLPSLPMFLLMPWMLKKGISFPASLGAGIALTGVLYFVMTKVLARFGMNL